MNIVFDIGNVICEWNAEKLVNSVFSDKKEQEKALIDIIGHADWLNLDRGTLTIEEAIPRSCDRTQIREELVRKLYDETPRSLLPFPETVKLIQEFQEKGHRLYVLSNMHRHAYEYLTATYNFWGCFTGIVISSHIHTIKPEAEIYEHLINTWNLVPKDTIFLDDLECNLVAASKFGIRTIQVISPDRIRHYLEKELELLPVSKSLLKNRL